MAKTTNLSIVLLVEEGHGERPLLELVDTGHRVPAAAEGSMETRLTGAVEVDVHSLSICPAIRRVAERQPTGASRSDRR